MIDSRADGEPSTHGSNGSGQDARGRFRRGNKMGRGNPQAGQAAKVRAAVLATMTPADAAAITRKLVEMAMGGDLAAIRELLNRAIGKP
jgi:hypothetical protein